MRERSFIRWKWSCILCICQIFLMTVFWRRMGEFGCFMGVDYNREEWDMLLLSFWMLYHVGFGAILGCGLQKSQTENSMMAIVRYGTFSRYYRKILAKILMTAIIYDGMSLLGVYIGMKMVYSNGIYYVALERLFLTGAVVFFCHLFCGLLMGVCIVRYDRVREAILIYPGVLIFNLFLSNIFPKKWLAVLPGNWMHMARSNWYVQGGYSMQTAFIFSTCGAVILYMVLYFRMGKQ